MDINLTIKIDNDLIFDKIVNINDDFTNNITLLQSEIEIWIEDDILYVEGTYNDNWIYRQYYLFDMMDIDDNIKLNIKSNR